MPQALKTLCLIHFWGWKNSPFPYGPSGVIRIGLPVWKWKRWKMIPTKWAQGAANGPVWMPQGLKALCLIQFWCWVISLFSILALWGNKNWPPQCEGEKVCRKPTNKSVKTGIPLNLCRRRSWMAFHSCLLPTYPFSLPIFFLQMSWQLT